MIRSKELRVVLCLAFGCLLWQQTSYAQVCEGDVCGYQHLAENLQRGALSNLSCVLDALRLDSFEFSLQPTVDGPQCTIQFSSDETKAAEVQRFLNDELKPKYEPLRSRYTVLLINDLEDKSVFYIRGIHLATHDPNRGTRAFQARLDSYLAADRPQLSFTFQRVNGTVQVVDINLTTQTERENQRTKRYPEIGSAERTVLDIINQLEAAYNKGSADEIRDELTGLLGGANIWITKFEPDPTTQNSYRERRYKNDSYIANLYTRFSEYLPDVTFEKINIYPSGENPEQVFYVTLVQHWMYREPQYQDSDFIALEIDLRDTQYPIQSREAGRGRFSVRLRVNGKRENDINLQVELGELDGEDVNRTTGEGFSNVPLQYHYLTIDDAWFENNVAWNDVAFEDVDDQRTEVPADSVKPIITGEEPYVFIDLKPTPAALHLCVLPEGSTNCDSASDTFTPQLYIQKRDSVTYTARGDFNNDRPLDLDYSDLHFVEDYTKREVMVRLTHEYYETIEEPLTLHGPDSDTLYTLFMKRKKGTLVAQSTPPDAEIEFIPPEVLDEQLTLPSLPLENTNSETDLEVTGERPKYALNYNKPGCFVEQEGEQLVVADEACLEAELRSLYVPSDTIQFSIQAESPTAVDHAFNRLEIQDLTDKGSITAALTREGNQLTINYTVLDESDRRRRRFRVDFDQPEGVSCPSTGSCINHKIRASQDTSFTWVIPEQYPASPPVVTLSRRNWVLTDLPRYYWIPVAVGGGYLICRHVFDACPSTTSTTVFPPPRPPVNF